MSKASDDDLAIWNLADIGKLLEDDTRPGDD